MALTMFGCRLHGKSVAYAATSLGAHLINPVFYFYYVKVYLNRFHVTEPWFQLAQLIFMVWNAINDPLFGCLQDNARFLPAMQSRRQSILYGAPLYVLSFILAWFPWSDYDVVGGAPPWVAGLQLTAALCLYDALFTFVLLAQCALMAELATEQTDRVRLVRYSQAASLIGSVSVLICDYASDGLNDFATFQMICIGLGVAAGTCFVYTGLNASTQFDSQDPCSSSSTPSGIKDDEKITSLSSSSLIADTSSCASVHLVLKQTCQIFGQPSFISFVLTNLCQIYHMTFLTNFANIIGDQLIGNSMTSSSKSLLYGMLFILPQLLVVVCAPIVSRVGYYKVIRSSFLIKIICGFIFLAVGWDYPSITAIFFIIECANTSGTFSLFGLCLSDVIDVDLHRYQRGHPLSSMVFGLNALVTKPAISLAPMITVAILNHYGYSSVVKTLSSSSGAPSSATSTVALTTATDPLELTAAMFYTTCLVPIITGLIQLVTWHFYTIRDSHKCGSHKMTSLA